MSSAKDTRQEAGMPEPPPQGKDQEHGGHSGEGAASALAHLKNQTKQHRRQTGETEDPSSGSPGQ